MQPLKLGPVTIHNPLVQAPLAGYTCAPFRKIAWKYGKPGFAAT
jgi:tRNA-dihydrouridine synthase